MMDAKTAADLRAPFPPEKVSKLPKTTCRACSRADGRVCGDHQKSRCEQCGSYITTAHIHLDYVGHADVTGRLLEVDPGWTWEPAALTPIGLPAIDEEGGLWIRLTVAGVTRLGYGHADGKSGPDAVKEAIGDALRNAAMRFGVALDLWRKETHAEEERPRGRPRRAPKSEPEPEAQPAITREQARENFIYAARRAIDAAESTEALDEVAARISDGERKDIITPDDAVQLRRRRVNKLDLLVPAREREAMAAGSAVTS